MLAPWLLALGGLYAAACVPGLTGAPCNTNDNCPSGQVCVAGKCELGSGGGSGGAGGGAGGGGDDGGAGGGGGGAGGGAGGGVGGGAGGGGGGAGGGGGGCGNTQTDPANCGSCGNICPTPVRATATCVAGVCGRSACQAGFFDIDGAATFGCESTCTGRTCTLPDGGSLTTSNDPLPETGLQGKSVVSGSSVGANVQTNTTHSNLGSIGEATPRVGGGIETSNAQHKHRGGFGAKVK